MESINRDDADAFITLDGSEIREIMSPANSAVKNQSLAEAIVYPGQETTKHYHKTVEEIYYFLSGSGYVEIDGEKRPVAAGDAVANPPGTVSSVMNTGLDPLIFLCCCAPAYFREDVVLLEQ
jgi:mannose-6-phosphate isomerase-like protein (cupin superfamily)